MTECTLRAGIIGSLRGISGHLSQEDRLERQERRAARQQNDNTLEVLLRQLAGSSQRQQ